jgi:hypothetical protein
MALTAKKARERNSSQPQSELQMDLLTGRPPTRTADARRSAIRDANVVHILALDGTVATIRRILANDTFQLTVEARDREATREIESHVARNPESVEFGRIVAEMKAELLAPRARRPAH